MTVRHELRDGALTITLDRPEKRNAMTDEMWSALRDVLAAAAEDDAVRAVVLTGAGGAFCAGSDVGGLLDEPATLPDRMRVSNECVLAVHQIRVPTVAVVDGVAAGSGANLALACDIVLASERARFLQLFIRRGLSLDSGASWLLPRLVGHRRAVQLSLLGDELDAPTALEWGAVTAVVPSDTLGEAVSRVVARLTGVSTHALAGTKRLLTSAWTMTLEEALEAEISNQVEVIASPEASRAITAFTAT